MIALVFPGQGSQSVGMVADLAAAFPVVRETFDVVAEAAGTDLWALASDGPAEQLGLTEHTQPALLAAGVAAWRVWQELDGPAPACLAGHSLGEYAALVAAGTLDLADAGRLVSERARAMQAAVPAGTGAMAAVLKLDDEQVAAICAAAPGRVTPANFNSPGQVVIAGEAAAVAAAGAAAREAGGRVMPLKVSVPSHCELMEPAARRLSDALAAVTFRTPSIPVLHNVDVASHDDPAAIRRALVDQLSSPVRWTGTVEAFAARGVTRVGECGPGKVLTGLVKRIDRSLEARALGTVDGMRETIESWSGQ